MKDLIKEYFLFQKSDRNGILFLSVLLVILIVLPHGFTYVYTPQYSYSDDFKNQVNAILPYLEEGRKKHFTQETKFDDKSTTTQKTSSFTKTKKELPPPFNFDPNKLTIDQSIGLGFSEKQAKVIEKYIRNGGTFYKKEDFKKLFVVNEEMYEHLKNHIKIEPRKKDNQKNKKPFYKEENELVYEKNKEDSSNKTNWNLSPFNPNELNKKKGTRSWLSQKNSANHRKLYSQRWRF